MSAAKRSLLARALDDRIFVAVTSAVATVLLAAAAWPGLSDYRANIVGQLACFALLAVALDLIWGYAGILSLGHGLFFAIGGYVAGMHLLEHSVAVTGITPDIVQFMGWKALPGWWGPLESFPVALAAALGVAFVVAFLFGWVSFRSRVGGVYFAIITQALTYVAMLLMFRNDTGFGGNNGMTGFQAIFGVPFQSPGVARGLAVASLASLVAALVGCRLLTIGRFGRLLVATRDDEVRLRSLGYETLRLKLAVWCVSAVLAAVAGLLYAPQVGIINPRVLSPDLSIEIAVWCAIGGRGRLAGAVIGAALVNALKFSLSATLPDLWPFVLAGLVILVALIFPNGLLDIGRWRPTLLSRAGALQPRDATP
ncbi:urea ABC transporter permease subunit UrtC [Hansschlegelia zhihuaiae]|uniref:Urea ABC transporter permease subunit UrtC n=1 Tax=Hansschlegelia zhihuaiae TaxID=405005 RepID=A0A4V1KJS0_9HYPH|nr:urea ABC transporter permease subunit UrtC [Hansschlegelia zhihuaiae]RXF75162.1 urea ABC transporter permease subunit UrtC [Hansschlegelia zhihuaiae]